jgi:hypothetical protein
MQLATQSNGLFLLAKAKVKRNGLVIDEGLNQEQWIDGVIKPLSNLIQTMEESARWWWGDALAYGEQNFGNIAEMSDRTGLSYDSMKACKYVSQRIDLSRRRPELSWSHHAEIAMAINEPDARDQWLDKASKEGMSKSQLRKAIRLSKAEYADPPNTDAGQFAPIAAAKELRTFFQQQDVKAWDQDRCLLWINDLHPIAEAYHIMRSRFTVAQ